MRANKQQVYMSERYSCEDSVFCHLSLIISIIILESRHIGIEWVCIPGNILTRI
jgi:hypothetical protein